MIRTFIFDTSAVLRFLKREAGYERVGQLLGQAKANLCDVVISAVNWGEVVYLVTRKLGIQAAEDLSITFSGALKILSVDSAEAERSAAIKIRYNFGYADCFGVQLASILPNSTLLTADFGVIAAEHQISIEFLPPLPVQ